MDEDLQRLLRLQSLQRNIITYRSNPVFYRIIKETCTTEMKNLVNVEIDLVEKSLRIPDAEMVPPVPNLSTCSQLSQQNLDDILKHYEDVKKGLHLLS